MSVVEVRRHLNEIRKAWGGSSHTAPFYIASPLVNTDMTISEFAFRFVQCHHRQRTKPYSASGAEA